MKTKIVLVVLVVVSMLFVVSVSEAKARPILGEILERLISIDNKLTVISEKESTGGVAISLKCSWKKGFSDETFGHCEPQQCPLDYSDMGTSDVVVQWVPNTVFGYTERWCVK